MFALGLNKINARNWDFTFADIADDLSAIYKALGFFLGGIPQMRVDVYRYRNGPGGPSFLAADGGFSFGIPVSANTSVA